MHAHFLDPYRPRSSLYHRLDARVKLVFSLAFILTSALIPHGAWPAYILLFTVAIIVELLSDLGVGYVLKRSVLALPFVLAALPVIFTYQQGDVVFTISIGSWTLQAYSGGVERFISVALRSWLSVQVAIVLAASTPFPDLLRAMRAIHIPRLIVAIFGLMWRYLFVLVDEAMRLMRAAPSRSSHSDQAGFKPVAALSGGRVLQAAWQAVYFCAASSAAIASTWQCFPVVMMAKSAPSRYLNSLRWTVFSYLADSPSSDCCWY